MSELLEWHIWLIAAGVLLVLEMTTGTFFLFCFALGAIGAAIAGAAGLSSVWMWAAFVLISGAAIPFSRKISERLGSGGDRQANTDRLLDMDGVVQENINTTSGTGRVQVGGESWRARSADDSVIGEGTRIKVIEVQGVHLLVEKL